MGIWRGLSDAAKLATYLATRGQMKFLACQMKCMLLGEKTGHQRTERDKSSNLGEKTENMPTQRDKPPIWVCEDENR
ncbi:hypothetical protein TNCV_788611 [Trichonephila clavipes]|nr:hypothetical protein TNCV_788611 [Trichonephila clavipes]